MENAYIYKNQNFLRIKINLLSSLLHNINVVEVMFLVLLILLNDAVGFDVLFSSFMNLCSPSETFLIKITESIVWKAV